MVVRVSTVAFEGIEARPVDVQVQIMPGRVVFNIVGLPDKAVAESRERVRSALVASGLALPAQRITVNLAPADLPKEGSHYDLPIALGVMAAIGAIPADALDGYTVLGELSLDGSHHGRRRRAARRHRRQCARPGAHLPGGVRAGGGVGGRATWRSSRRDRSSSSPTTSGARRCCRRPSPIVRKGGAPLPDLRDIKGQESAKRALEIAAAGGHNLLMIGPPGSGKSMLAARLPSILPPLTPGELLEVSMIQSVAGHLAEGALTDRRPFRAPHHSASMAALVGGGIQARPGEVSLAHHGVLFLDELPEFQPQVLDSLRQPLETGEITIARANRRVVYPARFQLVAAMNPCRCGRATGARLRLPHRAERPLHGAIPVPHVRPVPRPHRPAGRGAAVSAADLILPPPAEGSAEVAARVAAARQRQTERYAALGLPGVRTNAACPAAALDEAAALDPGAIAMLRQAADAMRLTARGYHRVLKVARTLADLDGEDAIGRIHLSEALLYRSRADIGPA